MASKKLRFDIFKRDQFTCQYCGRKPPAVLLELDHIVPLSQGGKDEFANLITACFDCNRGKGHIPLGFTEVRPDLIEQMAVLKEKEQQLRAYEKLRASIRQREDADIERVSDMLRAATDGGQSLSHGMESIRYFLTMFSVLEIGDALTMALRKKGTSRIEDTFRYMCGILHNWRRAKDGS